MSTSESKHVRDFVLIGLHIAFALILLLFTLFEHGPQILTADETAALGFMVFFVLGLPILLVTIGTILLSLLANQWWLTALAASLAVTFVLAVINFWTGILASLGYFSFAVWALVQSRAAWRSRERGATELRSEAGRLKRAVFTVLISAVVLIAIGFIVFGVSA